MNKKMVTVLAAMSVLGATTAFAVNPFSDVTPDDWAYQAVAQLAYEGVIEGYPDGTFKGERNITRYEMAQMVARAMAREDQINAEQQAQIDRLAAEFANELNSLGVRVTNLEDRVGNVKVGGDARIRVMRSYTDTYFEDGYDKEDKVDARIGLDFDARVSDKTEAFARVEATFGFGKYSDDDDGDVELDELYVRHYFNDQFALQGGRYDVTLGATGILYDDTFDGVSLMYNDRFNLELGYGSFKEMSLFLDDLIDEDTDFYEPDAWYVQAGVGLTDEAELKAFYMQADGWMEDYAEYWGFGLDANFNDFNLHGDYVKNEGDYVDEGELWTAGLRFGKANLSEVGSFQIGIDYVDMEKEAFLGGTTLSLGDGYMGPQDGYRSNGAEFWLASLSFVPFENSKLNAYYSFGAEDKDGYDYEDLYRVELNYYF